MATVDLDRIGEAALPVLLFYLVIMSHYMPPLLGCSLQNVMRESALARHVVGFLLLLFLVILTNPQYADRQMPTNVLTAAAIYAWFYVTTRAPFYISIAMLGALLVAYVGHVAYRRYVSEGRPSGAMRALQVRNFSALSVLLLSVVGFAVYAMDKHGEHSDGFSWAKMFNGSKCRTTNSGGSVLSMFPRVAAAAAANGGRK
jgi:multisubunit Na+/H+ antiporter MnhF subunit